MDATNIDMNAQAGGKPIQGRWMSKYDMIQDSVTM